MKPSERFSHHDLAGTLMYEGKTAAWHHRGYWRTIPTVSEAADKAISRAISGLPNDAPASEIRRVAAEYLETDA